MESDTPPPLNPPSEKRKKILDMAFKQLRKARAKIDPSILKKIRRMIAGNPEMMKSLGVNETLQPIVEKPQKKRVQRAGVVVDAAVVAVSVGMNSKEEAIAQIQKQKKRHKDRIVPSKVEADIKPEIKLKPKLKDGEYEKVDQGKNMEVLAKLMMLNPKGKNKIKAAIKKASE